MFLENELIRSRLPSLFVSHARARRVDPTPILRRLDLCPDLDRDEISTLPLATMRRLCDELAEAARDPFFGFDVARNAPRGAYGLLEFVVRAAPNLATALQLFIRWVRVVNSALVPETIEDGGRFALQLHVRSDPSCLGRQANEFVVALLIGLAREMTGEAIAPRRVWLAHPRPSEVEPLIAGLGTDRILFGATVIGIEMDATQLAQPIVSCDAALYAFLHRMLVETAERERPNAQFDALRARIRDHLNDGEPKIEEIAAELHVSVRSLQRKLADRGTSFREVVDEVRKELARRLLDDDAHTLGDVAMQLGYSDVRAFARAWKRWTGRPPGASRS